MSGGERGQRGKETSSSKVGGAAASGAGSTMLHFIDERRWVLLKIPRCDIDGVGEGK